MARPETVIDASAGGAADKDEISGCASASRSAGPGTSEIPTATATMTKPRAIANFMSGAPGSSRQRARGGYDVD